MSEFMHYHESMLIVMCRIEILGIDTEHTGEFILAYFPDMEIFDFTASISFDFSSYFLYNRIIHRPIYEDNRSISQEKIGPTKDEY